jgi:UDPglucose--hexose-1-phosphate uridylyltransferase
MPELRKDPIVGRWVIIATERARRPGNFVDATFHNTDPKDCPFCHDKDSKEIYALRDPKDPQAPWKVRVVESGTPLFSGTGSVHRRGHGLYDMCDSFGAHEVVIETPEHIANMADLSVEQIKNVFETYSLRINHHKKNPDFQYALAYKNYGKAAGSRLIGHARSQIMATPVNPIRVKDKISGAKKYYEYHERCLFCDIIRQEKNSGERVVVETQHFLAVTPFASRFPFEVWVLPKVHACDFAEGVAGYENDLAKMMKELLLRIKIGMDDPAYNYVIQTAPFRLENSGGLKYRTIEQDYHWHMEILPRISRVAGFEKGTGFYICPIPPENTARFLREVKI